MGTLQGPSEANLIVNQRQTFEKELGIPGMGEDDRAPSEPNRVWVGINNNIFYTGQDGEVREIVPFDPSILDDLFPAQYLNPQLSLSIVESNPRLSDEVGTTYSYNFKYEFTKNDAGEPISFSFFRDGTPLSAGNYVPSWVFGVTDTYEIAPDVYKAQVSYGQGNVKQNSIGTPSPDGVIQAGTIDSNLVTIRGYYNSWYGSVASDPLNSASVRTLTAKLGDNLNKFNLSASTVMQVIVVSPDMELASVVDLDALNYNLTSQYILTGTMTVNDAQGRAISGYKKYIRTQGVPYTTPHRHEVTLKRI